MFGDFLGLVVDTLLNQAAKYWYITNEQASVPLVVRSAVGAGGSLGACHSQIPTSLFLGEPGIALAAPATPADAKGLLKSAIRDDNPVIVFEHKLLYGRRGEVADGDEAIVPLGRAAVRRVGGDVTIVAALRMVEVAQDAAETLASEGISASVVDLRTLRPLDKETVAESVAHTRRLVVVEEGHPTGGYGPEVIASAVELVGPITARRVTMPDHPIPFATMLEAAVLPDTADVIEAVRDLLL
jgi:pyruvate/2-oxoglutarate/acetoin dehydrogenase E1 component